MSSEIFKRNVRLEEIFNRAAVEYDTIGPKYFKEYKGATRCNMKSIA